MAKIRTVIVGLGLALIIGVHGSAKPAAEDEAYADIKKQADLVGKKNWDDLAKDGKALAKKHEDMLDIMNAFKLRKGKIAGIGVGDTPEAIQPDGIEAKIINISKKPMNPTTLEKEQKDLIRMAEISAAIASITVHQCPVEKKTKDRDPKDWNKWMKDMYDESNELIKALKEKNALGVKSAAFRLNGTCVECHAVFRDKVP